MTTTAPRFAGLQSALADISAENHTRIARIRAVAKGETFTGRLATTKRTAAEPAKPAARSTTPAAPSRAVKASAPPKPLPLAIPADVVAKGPEAVAAFKQGHARAEARLSALAKHPAAAGRSAEVLSMFRAGKTDTEIVAQLTKGQRAKAADAVWARAIAKVHGPTREAAADQPQQATTSGNNKAAGVWDRAWAKVTGQQGAAQ
jgi:hypothetical protein